MKIIYIILITFSLTSTLIAEEVDVAKFDSNTTALDKNVSTQIDMSEDENIEDDQMISQEPEIQKESLSEFEKLFVNHIAYNYYKTAIKALYQDDYKSAYENAMNAKDIVDNTDLNITTIALPFMPSFMRESSYSPKRTYYKIIKEKEYELKRLITKVKLISPPIASVVIHRSSTTIDVILRNHGDLPFDKFEVLVNEKPIALFNKLLPNEEQTIRIEKAPKLYEVSFKEKYGFAPKSFVLDEGY